MAEEQELTAEQIDTNWQRYKMLCGKLGERSEPALAMCDSLGERLVFCPASSRAHYHLAIPGGLVDHSLRVFVNARNIVKAFSWDIPLESLIVASLFHDLGKVGSDQLDNYVVQTDSWKRDNRGENYTYNKELTYMNVPLRSVWLCQRFGVRLTYEETIAIYLNDGFVVDQNKEYCLKEPPLATAIWMADYVSTRQEKGDF